MKNLIIRTITGLVFMTIILGSILLSRYAFLLVILLINFLALKEYFKLISTSVLIPQKAGGMFFGALLILAVALYTFGIIPGKFLLLTLLFPIILYSAELYRKSDNPFQNIAQTILGIIYISLPLSLLNFFFSPFSGVGETNTQVLIGFFMITWLVDTGAYLGGMAFGKHRLFERISPKKSWEGAIGGLLIGILVAYFYSLIFKDIPYFHWIIISVIITITGGFGDLVESMLKRSIQVKDTGTIMPGHGGILDRFDCVFFSSPFIFIYLQLFINNSGI